MQMALRFLEGPAREARGSIRTAAGRTRSRGIGQRRQRSSEKIGPRLHRALRTRVNAVPGLTTAPSRRTYGADHFSLWLDVRIGCICRCSTGQDRRHISRLPRAQFGRLVDFDRGCPLTRSMGIPHVGGCLGSCFGQRSPRFVYGCETISRMTEQSRGMGARMRDMARKTVPCPLDVKLTA